MGELGEKNEFDPSVITDSLEKDKIAKMFNKPEVGCAVYIYYEPQGFLNLLGMNHSPGVQVNGSRDIWMDGETYMLFNVLPGTVSLKYGKIFENNWQCQTGDIRFFVKKELLKTKPSSEGFQFVDASIGRKEISKRRLLLPP